MPLTFSGIVVLAIGFSAYLAGWQLGWIELMVIAAGALLALLSATPWILGRSQLEVRRTVQPRRVTARADASPGDDAEAHLTVVNHGSVPSIGRMLEERIDGAPYSIAIGRLPTGNTSTHKVPLPTDRRGIVRLGPVVLSKADPLGLMRRDVAHSDSDVLFVHPRQLPVNPLPIGFAKDLEGPTTDASPAGDVAFHTLREYQIGDDYRHIHWPSTARTGWLVSPQIGSLMVRHYVDNRRPHMTIVLDNRKSSYSDEQQFERAVEVTASLAVSSMRAAQPLAIRCGYEVIVGQSRPGVYQDALDRLADVSMADDGDLVAASLNGLQGEIGTSALVVVSGNIRDAELMPVATFVRRTAHPMFIRIWPPAAIQAGSIPRATMIDVDSLEGFRFAWNRVIP